ncbi:MAG: cytochrome c [Bdellovibrionota bacterium]
MMSNKTFSLIVIGLAWVVLSVGYTNCSGGFSSLKGDGVDRGDFSSGSGSQALCEQDLKNVFINSYLPHLKDMNKCGSCHSDNGVAAPKLASSDSTLAYSTFRQYGPDLIDANATSTTHAPTKTGAQNATAFSVAHQSWNTGLTSYNSCMANLPVAGSTPVPLPTADSLEMVGRNIPTIYYNAGAAQIVEWDMANQVQPNNARFAGKFQIDIRVVYATDANGVRTATGYAFARPRAKLLLGEVELDVDGVIPRINGQDVSGAELMASSRALARGIDYTTIYNGEVIIARPNVSSADEISIVFRYFKVRARTDNPPSPPVPTVTLSRDNTNNVTVNASTGNDGTARRWCLTANPTPVRSASEPCPGFQLGTTNGWSEARPTSVNLSSLGRNPNSGETVRVYYWVVNSDLKVNPSPGTDTVVFDSTAPAKATLASVSLGGTQIADLNGLTDSDETVQWCVSVSPSNAIPQNCMGSYVGAKPSYIGLPYNGTNYVSIWVRDLAGNETQPAMGDIRSVVNTYGRIDFQQLTTGGTARSIFQTNCASCHSSGMAEAAKWTSSDYLNTESKEARIKATMDGGAPAMPASGLISAKDRALIRLWFDQTGRPLEYGP